MNYNFSEFEAADVQRQKAIDEKVEKIMSMVKLDKLNVKERNFIDSVVGRTREGRDLTQKQSEWLTRIFIKCKNARN